MPVAFPQKPNDVVALGAIPPLLDTLVTVSVPLETDGVPFQRFCRVDWFNAIVAIHPVVVALPVFVRLTFAQ